MSKTIWTLEDAKRRHRHSPGLAVALADLLPRDEPVLDLGCGCGYYLNELAQGGFRCLGVEGTPGIAEIALFSRILMADLSQPLKLDWPRSSVICLEVGEHLLPEQESQLLSNIDRYCLHWLVLSWAVPGQAGHGHHNCRSNDYLRERLEERSFDYRARPTAHLRAAADRRTSYFRRTLQVFRRSGF
jgi:SAM-dependent methyltransferase